MRRGEIMHIRSIRTIMVVYLHLLRLTVYLGAVLILFAGCLSYTSPSTTYEIDKPTEVNVSDRTFSDRIELTWEQHSPNVTFTIYRAEKDGGPSQIIAQDLRYSRYTDTDIQPDSSYWYQISVIDLKSGYESLPSPVVRGRTNIDISLLEIDDHGHYIYPEMPYYTIQTSSTPRQGGYIRVRPNPEQEGYEQGTEVTFTPVYYSGYQLERLSGPDVFLLDQQEDDTYTYTMQKDLQITAHWKQNRLTIAIDNDRCRFLEGEEITVLINSMIITTLTGDVIQKSDTDYSQITFPYDGPLRSIQLLNARFASTLDEQTLQEYLPEGSRDHEMRGLEHIIVADTYDQDDGKTLTGITITPVIDRESAEHLEGSLSGSAAQDDTQVSQL
jgi:hypothetical protein